MTQLISEILIYDIDTSLHILNKQNWPSGELNLLSDAEKKRALKFGVGHLCSKFEYIHVSARKILISLLGENPEISYMPKGKPYLINYPDIKFNLSHAQNRALFAVTLFCSLGIDIEYHHLQTDCLAIAKRFFSKEEHELLTMSSEPDKLFYQLWTRKEAALKTLGSGIFGQLNHTIPEMVNLYEFSPAKHYTATLAWIKEPQYPKKIVFKHLPDTFL